MNENSSEAKRLNRLVTELGEGYRVQTIDFEPCIVYRINDCYDIEFSGAWDGRHKNATAYLWQLKQGLRIITSMRCDNNVEGIKHAVEELIKEAGQ